MRILPRVSVPTPKAARRLWRQSRQHLSLRRVYYSVEFILFAAVYFVIFSGSRLRFIDRLGSRADAIVTLLLVAAFICLHIIGRRLALPRIEVYYAPTPYDEHKIFLDLGQGTQDVTSIDQLYQQLADRIRGALEASNSAIFVRDDMSGCF